MTPERSRRNRSRASPTLVVVVVLALSAYHLATLARLSLEETASRGQMLAQAIFQRAKEVVAAGGADPYEALRADGGMRSIIESSVGYSENVTYAAIVNKDGIAVAHTFPTLEGQPLAEQEDLAPLACAPARSRSCAPSIRTAPLKSASRCSRAISQFGSIRIGVSTLLVRSELRRAVLRRRRHRARRARRVVAVRDAAVAVDAAADSCDPERAVAARTRRARRQARSAGAGVPATSGSSFDAVSAQLSRSVGARPIRRRRAPAVATDLESVDGQPRGCGGAVFAARRTDLLQQGHERAAAARRSIDALPADAPGEADRRAHAGGPANRRGRCR